MTTEAPPRTRPSREELEREPTDWLSWYLRPYLCDSTGHPVAMAAHHAEFWQWAWQIERGRSPVIDGREREGIVACWARGGAKSTSAEMMTTALAARLRRKYALYVSGKQSQADDHVWNIGDMMTAPHIAEDYPELADRARGTYGPAAWRRNRLMAANGFTVDALGLDTAMRGVKLGRERPDLIILDDIDDVTDSAYLTGQKLLRITRSLIPTGAQESLAIVAIQNLVLRGGIFDRLVHGTAGFLQGAILQGPIPALRECVIENVPGHAVPQITHGVPTWPGGQSVAVCQAYINRFGLEAFLAECQHEVLLLSGLIHGRFSPSVHRWPEELPYPRFTRMVGGLDHGSEGETAHPTAGLVGGVTGDGRVLLLAEFKERGQDIAVRLQTWMREQENRWRGSGSIQWASDGTEHLGNQLLRANGFNVTPSKMGGRDEASREGRVRAVGRRLALDGQGRPGLMYVAELRGFVDEIESYKRAQPRFEGDRTQPHILRTNDDEMSALEYLVELLDQHAPLPDPERPSVGEVLW